MRALAAVALFEHPAIRRAEEEEAAAAAAAQHGEDDADDDDSSSDGGRGDDASSTTSASSAPYDGGAGMLPVALPLYLPSGAPAMPRQPPQPPQQQQQGAPGALQPTLSEPSELSPRGAANGAFGGRSMGGAGGLQGNGTMAGDK